MLTVISTAFAVELHVAIKGSDVNQGTRQSPFRTIQHAAEAAQPGDVVTVHQGVYRERVNPPRGGTSATMRITYQAAPGEQATLTGSEPMKGWEKVAGDTWKVTVPHSYFGKFNPSLCRSNSRRLVQQPRRIPHGSSLSERQLVDRGGTP